MTSVPRALVSLLVLAAVAGAPALAAKQPPPKEKGTYKDWYKSTIDELEIVDPAPLAAATKVVVLPLDTANTPLPKKDNTLEPVKTVLGKSTDLFVTGAKKGAGAALEITRADAAPTGDDAKGVLVVRATVTEMNPGSKAARYWAGFGAGHSRVTIQGEVVDAATGNVLLKFTHARASSGGLFGGDYVKLMSENVDEVSEDVGKMLAVFRSDEKK